MYSIDKYGILDKTSSELNVYLSNKPGLYYAGNDEFIEDDICKIHYQHLVKGKVFINYGLIKPSDEEVELSLKCYILQKEYYPNCDNPIYGGCVIGDDYFEKLICGECNRIRDEYKIILGIK